MPAKLSVHPQGEDFITSMPCLLPEHERKKYFGLKVVSRIEDHIPALQSDIFLYDAKTGELLAIMDGNWITAMRTGAVAALAARTFQKQSTNTYSMLGLGNIARAVTLCLIDDNRDRQITIKLLRYKDQAELFINRFKAYNNVTFEIIDDKTAFVSEADVLISCVTVAKELLFPDDALFKKGVTVIPVHMRGFQNCDLFFDKVYGDETSQIKNFKYFDKFRQYDEIHHVLQGKNSGRTNNDERILCYNYGIALHDIVFASRIYEKTISTQIGFDYHKESKKVWV
jgi:ornithine cyclodeaminase